MFSLRNIGLTTPSKSVSVFKQDEDIKDDFEDRLRIDSRNSTKKGKGAGQGTKISNNVFSGYNKTERRPRISAFNRHINDNGVHNMVNMSEINLINESKLSLNQTEILKLGFNIK